jgi:LysR family transcriptional regulator, hypochlorite-specific transcription factor HypT
MGMAMDFRWLQDFTTLAELGNFTEAAEARHSSQPAFSRRIQALEAWLGVELIDRSSYPTKLTAAGESFRPVAAGMLVRLSDARAELLGQPTTETASLTFALPQTLSLCRFPGWWADWRKISGASTCRLLARNVHDSVTALVTGHADILICYHHAQQPTFLDPDAYDRSQIDVDWLRPYCNAANFKGGNVLPGTVRTPVPFLSFSAGTYLGRMTELAVLNAPEKAHLKRVFEADLADAILSMVIAGHGVGWLPDSTVRHYQSPQSLRRAGDDRWALPLAIFAYCHRERANAAAQRLMAHLKRAERKSPAFEGAA